MVTDAARRLADALAAQLAAAAPAGVDIRAEGRDLVVTDGASPVRIGVGAIVDQPGDPEEHVATAAWSVLSAVQDYVTEAKTVPWPSADEPGRLPLPHAVWASDHLRLLYGDPDDPVLELPGVMRAELERED